MKRVLEYLIPMVVAMVVYAVASCLILYIYTLPVEYIPLQAQNIVIKVLEVVVGVVVHVLLYKYNSKRNLTNWKFYVLCYLVPLVLNVLSVVLLDKYGGYALMFFFFLLPSIVELGSASVVGGITLLKEGLH